MNLIKMAKIYEALQMIAKNAMELAEEEVRYAKQHMLPSITGAERSIILNLIENDEPIEMDFPIAVDDTVPVIEESENNFSMLPETPTFIKRQRMTDAEKKYVYDVYAAGLNADEILIRFEQKFGRKISKSSVNRIVHNNGMEENKTTTEEKPIDLEKAAEESRMIERGEEFKKKLSPEIIEFIKEKGAQGCNVPEIQALIYSKFSRDVSVTPIHNILNGKIRESHTIAVPESILAEMKADGLDIINGDVYFNGERAQHFIGMNFEKCIEYKGLIYPVKYIVAQFHGIYSGKSKLIRLKNRDILDTRIENIVCNTNTMIPHTTCDESIQRQISESLAKFEGDIFRAMDWLYHNMKDSPVSITTVRRILNKERYADISDEYFSKEDVNNWRRNSKNHTTRIIIEPSDFSVHSDSDMSKYEYICLKKTNLTVDEKEFVVRYLLEEEPENHTKIQKWSSIKTKIKATGFSIKGSFIKAILNKEE